MHLIIITVTHRKIFENTIIYHTNKPHVFPSQTRKHALCIYRNGISYLTTTHESISSPNSSNRSKTSSTQQWTRFRKSNQLQRAHVSVEASILWIFKKNTDNLLFRSQLSEYAHIKTAKNAENARHACANCVEKDDLNHDCLTFVQW